MSEATTDPKLGLSGQGRECVVLDVEGMTCGHCANAVQRELAAAPGVVSAEVDLDAGTAKVVGSAALPELEAAVERAGYKVGGRGKPDTARQGGCGC